MTDSMPEVVRGRVDSYAANSEGYPLTGTFPLVGGGYLAFGSTFLSAGAAFAPFCT
jgi:hypothetical protein